MPSIESPQSSQLTEMSVSAHLNPRQRSYLDKLVREWLELKSRLKTSDMKDSYDLALIRRIKAKQEEALAFVKNKEMRHESQVDLIEAITPKGEAVAFELHEQAEYWNEFYKRHGITWVEMIPKNLGAVITAEEVEKMQELIKRFGFNRMIIIPDNLVGDPEVAVHSPRGKSRVALNKPAAHYGDLYKALLKGQVMLGYYYKKSKGIGATRDKRHGLRILLAIDDKELDGNELFKSTHGLNAQTLRGCFDHDPKWRGLSGMAESEYLICQQEYLERTGKRLDERYSLLLPESERPATRGKNAVSYRVVNDNRNIGMFMIDEQEENCLDGGLLNAQGCRLVACIDLSQ